MLIGIANIIPGLSGGTIAVMLKIYEQMIDHMDQFFKSPFKNKTTTLYLMKLGFGAAIGIALFAKLISLSIENYPTQSYFAFMGLILGSIPMVYQSRKIKRTFSTELLFFLSAVSLISITFISKGPNIIAEPSLILLFISGAIASSAMIIPGISGSFLLLLMGTYQSIVESVSQLNFINLFTIGAGAGIGLIGVTRLIKIILTKFPDHSHNVILGLLVGSMVKIWPGISMNLTGLTAVICFVCAAISVYLLSKLSKKSIGKISSSQ